MIVLAIVGANTDYSPEEFKAKVDAWIQEHGTPDKIITTESGKIDTMARLYAMAHHITLQIFVAQWNLHGRAAGPIRTDEMLSTATHVLAFPHLTDKAISKSAWSLINKAYFKHIPVILYPIQ